MGADNGRRTWKVVVAGESGVGGGEERRRRRARAADGGRSPVENIPGRVPLITDYYELMSNSSKKNKILSFVGPSL